MEILRLPNVSEHTLTVTGLENNELYSIEFTDLFTKEQHESEETSDAEGELVITLPAEYDTMDGNLLLEVSAASLAYVDDVQIVRPYSLPQTVSETFDVSVDDAIKAERIVRMIIDNMTGGFYYMKKLELVKGGGLDYLLMDEPIWELLELSENNVLLWEPGSDETYAASFDNTSVILLDDSETDRNEHRPIWFRRYDSPIFVEGYDYEVLAKFGWPVLPAAIKQASMLLIEDYFCGNLRYVNRYIEKYDNSAFKITYNVGAFAGTGNVMADRLLQPYIDNIRPRIL